MKSDIPLKRLTQHCPTDLLPLIGAADATVVRVESLELPTGKSSLDCVLHLLAPDGTPYQHIIEWQGWRDPVFVWRALGYLGWMGQNRPERPILITLIYLSPNDDVGDTLRQELPGQPGWMVQLPCVRLWEQDAGQAVASGRPGLVALSPLMAGATEALVEEAAQLLLHTTQPPIQADLLTALGVFAEPLFSAERFLHLITKERLMSSDLFQLVYQEQVNDWYHSIQGMVEDVLMVRFPTAPITLLRSLRRIPNIQTLQQLHHLILNIDDLSAIEHAIEAAATSDS